MAKRRGNHEGSFYKYPNGRWRAQVTINGRQYQSVFPTKADAQRWVRDLVRTAEMGGSPETSKMRLRDWVERWMKMRDIAPTTRKRDEDILRKHILPALGNTPISKIRRGQIELWLAEQREHTSSANAMRVLAVLRAALEKAKEHGLILTNPCAGISLRVERYQPVWSLDDIRNIVQASVGTRLRNIIIIALTTGMRMGEIIALRWSDIDWTGKRILIRYQVQWVDNRPQFVPPKSASGQRTISIDPYTEMALKDQYQQVHLWKQGATQWEEYDLVFPTTTGVPFRQENLGKLFRALLRRAGVSNRIRFHDLRHVHITLLAQSGVPLRDIQVRVGHADARTTYEIYTHALQNVSGVQVASALESVLSKNLVIGGIGVAEDLGELQG